MAIFFRLLGMEVLMVTKNISFPPELPEKLKRLRQNHGWSQGQLGQKLDINVQLISKYERGVVCPPTPMMIKIASVFNVSLDYLLLDDADTAVNKIKNQALLEKLEEIESLPE